jgi:hypothetical protein
MKGERIPDPHHISRLCFPKHIDNGEIQASAFMLKRDDESLSVNWLEYLNCISRNEEIEELRNIYSKKFKKVGIRSQIAVLNVGEVRNKVLNESSDRRNINVLHDPKIEDPSHSGIYNLRPDDIEIAELICETISETYSAH